MVLYSLGIYITGVVYNNLYRNANRVYSIGLDNYGVIWWAAGLDKYQYKVV